MGLGDMIRKGGDNGQSAGVHDTPIQVMIIRTNLGGPWRRMGTLPKHQISQWRQASESSSFLRYLVDTPPAHLVLSQPQMLSFGSVLLHVWSFGVGAKFQDKKYSQLQNAEKGLASKSTNSFADSTFSNSTIGLHNEIMLLSLSKR